MKLDNRFNKIVTTNEGPTFRVMGGKDVPWGIMPWAVAIYDDEDKFHILRKITLFSFVSKSKMQNVLYAYL